MTARNCWFSGALYS